MSGEHVDIAELGRKSRAAFEKLAKWRSVFAAWQLGTRSDTDGECRAVKNHREATIILRAEVNALTGILLEKGVCSQVELTRAMIAEAEHLDEEYQEQFPGMESTDMGIAMDVVKAQRTMKDLNFPA